MTKQTNEAPKIKWFKPLHSTPKTKSILVFDIEGAGGPNGFVCGAIAGVHTTGFYTDRKEMWNDLLGYGEDGTWLFAHNLEYDLPIVAGDDLFKGRLIFKTGGILWADYRYNKRRVRFYDSSNLFPYWSVAAIGEMIGSEKGEVSEEMLVRLSSGSQWSDFTTKEQDLIRKYCIQDAQIVARALLRLQDEVNSLGGEMKATLAGISMDVFRRGYLHRPWMVLNKDVNKAMRPAYYGGRVENFVFGKVENANLYDINSLYPYVLRVGSYPHPSYLRFVEGVSARRRLDTWEGIASATVLVGDVHIPPLPYRTASKLFFPTGRLRGLWTTTELRYALDNGAELIDLEWIFGTDTLFNPFMHFIEDIYKIRQGYMADGDKRHLLLKLIMNSLYGRFGLNPDKGLQQIVKLTADTDWSEFDGWVSGEINGELVMRGPMHFNSYPSYANVMIAAQVSALARIELHKALLEAGDDTLYCDTDSVLRWNTMSCGKGLGEWKSQMENGSASLLGPKEYVLHNKNTSDEYVVKGVPKRAKEEFVKTGTTTYRKAVKIREAIARGINPSEWVEMTKSHHPTLPKRLPVLPEKEWSGSYCRTVPWTVDQLDCVHSPGNSDLPSTTPSRLLSILPKWVVPLIADYE